MRQKLTENAQQKEIFRFPESAIQNPTNELATKSDENKYFVPAYRHLVLKPKEMLEVRIRNPIPNDANHAIVTYWQFGIPTVADKV